MDLIKRFSSHPAPDESETVRTLAIDLGTTNSTIAESIWMPGYPPMCRVLEIEQPLRTGKCTGAMVPSVVAVTDETLLVGEGARQLRSEQGKSGLTRDKNYFYETKNDMGLQKTYAGAPEDLDRAYKVAGYILAFLVEAAEDKATIPYRSISVTVPASFQLNQRRDTLRACQRAGLHLDEGNLLEEPAAALIDYLMSEQSTPFVPRQGEATCMIFDFGGGTCDVSVIKIFGNGKNKPLSLSELSISRYHRLGGGDIDVAIVHEVLLPALLKENNLTALDLSWAAKKKELEPQLIATAENLKIKLCRAICSLEEEGYGDATEVGELVATGDPLTCRLDSQPDGQTEKRELKLSQPSLSASQFEAVLKPFLDREYLYARETEYQMTQSIFSPIEDALDRAGISPEDIDFCLLTGGSALIPQVQKAVRDYFGGGTTGCYNDPEKMQTAVARGAAWNTIFKAITGQPLIQPVLHDGIAIETNDGGRHRLIEPGTPLPWPEDGSYRRIDLEIPQTEQLFVDELRIKLLGELDDRHIFNEVWALPKAACRGNEIVLEYRVTAGKQLECRAFLAGSEKEVFARTIENPLANVVNPGSIRLKIEETEEKLRKKNGGTAKDRGAFVQLAQWYRELQQQEKALHYLYTALKKIGAPDVDILNLQGNYYSDLADYDRAEKAYREAIRIDEACSIPLFNLALMYRDTKRYDEALTTVEQALDISNGKGPHLALKANVLSRMGRDEQAAETAALSLKRSDTLKKQDDWALGWYIATARLLKDDQALASAEAERTHRKKELPSEPDDDTPKPIVKNALTASDHKMAS